MQDYVEDLLDAVWQTSESYIELDSSEIEYVDDDAYVDDCAYF